MAAMGGMKMPGGWTMSMTWMRMPGQSWSAAAAAFIGMWTVMMVAMMLPSLTPMLMRYRDALGSAGESHASRLAALVGVAYFAVWTLFGVAAYMVGSMLAVLEMRWPALVRAVPLAAGVVVVIAGALQFSRWKARYLACCRDLPMHGRVLLPSATAAWRRGLRFGLHCIHCCVGLTTVLLIIGVMDLRAMVWVMAAITAERLAPNGERVAKIIGVAVVMSGLFMISRAITKV
jgi:predicted metal-binding membrane protein